MSIVIGHTYQYRPFNMQCTVTENAAERHRARITLADGRDVQEVPYHDLIEAPSAPAPVADAAAESSTEEAPAETEEPDKPAGRRFGRRSE